ncbi:hypothetical protein CRYUN_Cryun01aG0017400 [Craigia yunnanensis]
MFTAARPQQTPGQNFKPKLEWKHEAEASFLFVYLPGFAVEQLTITPDYSNRRVKVEGNRRLPINRLLPVNETFDIPGDCDLSKMDKQFGRGILMLKMPRNIVIPQLVPQQQTTKESKEEIPKPQETVGGSVTRKDEETDPPKETSTTGFEKQNPDKAAIVPSVTTTVGEKSAMRTAKSDEEKLVERKEENGGNGKPDKPESPESLVQNAEVKEEESKAQSKESAAITSAMIVANVEEKEKEKNLKPADDKAKEAEKENVNASAKKGMVKEVNEDRKLKINMVAAVLIIMGLGVSLFYTLGHKPVG